MAVDTAIKNAFVKALNDKFENKVANKKNDISGDFSTDAVSYPTANAVKTHVAGVAEDIQSDIQDLADSAFSGSYNDLTNKPNLSTVATSGSYADLTDKPNLSTVATSGSYTDLTDKPTLSTVAASGSYNDLTDKPELFDGQYSSLTGTPDLANVATSGDYEDLINTPTLSSLGGVVTVEKQTTAETGYIATYVVKQDGFQVGQKINIPKDYLVKSADIKTVTVADTPETGYAVGDKYLEFIINSKDGSATDEPLRVNVKDLIDTYTADESTLTLSNNQFKIKNGGITTTQLASSIVTSLGYADDFNSSTAKAITATDVANWNAKGSSNLTTADVDSEIEAYLTAITNAL